MDIPAIEFQVRCARILEGVFVVSVSGELDLYTAPQLGQQLDEVHGLGSRQVIVGLAAVTFIDSAALAVIAATAKRLSANGGRLFTVTDDPHTRKVLKITGLDRIMEIRRSLTEAIAETTGQ